MYCTVDESSILYVFPSKTDLNLLEKEFGEKERNKTYGG
jgi:hypothetical protein